MLDLESPAACDHGTPPLVVEDEAVAGLLTNRMVASDVNGATVPAGFTRITAFRSGVGGDDRLCYARFPETKA